ncbi:MAG: 50S ribosomal protein L24 [Clostridia bacterium]|nr:50S ribosomal protein L24 [Clostridia bacterium]
MTMSMTVKKGDNVVVIAGKEKGKTGKVVEVFPKDNRVLVDGLNIVTKHQKARKQDEKSAIVKKSAPIEASNVMVVCPVCGKATRVAHNEIDGKKVRTCKKCAASLDKEFVKATKKEAKKNIAKAEEKTAEQKSTKKTTAKAEA